MSRLSRSNQLIIGSVIAGLLIGIGWFGAPIVPALVGAIGAAAIIYLQNRRAHG